MSLIDDIRAELLSEDCAEHEGAARKACLLLEKAMGWESGWDLEPEVASEPVSSKTIAELKQILSAYVERHLPPPAVASAIHSLGKLSDPSLRPLFLKSMRTHAHLAGDPNILFQSMLALEDLGEKLFPDGGSASLGSQENLSLAIRYLRSAPE